MKRQIHRENKKRKRFQPDRLRCPYCGSPVTLRSADGIYRDNSRGAMLYVCSHYPECDAYVRVHSGTKVPMGSLANRELRALRRAAHHYFDQLYRSGMMSREDAYQWLAQWISAPLSEAHIGHLGEYYCRKVIEESQKLLQKYKDKQKRLLAGEGEEKSHSVGNGNTTIFVTGNRERKGKL